ncbi:MAG: RNA polymerase sigma factor [Anaerolineae bacterium]
MRERTNEEWLAELKGPHPDKALADLRAHLMRGLRYAFAGHHKLGDADLEDFAQEATVKALNAIDAFRGESRFTTWAQKIAIRVAYTELRRRRWQDVALEDLLPKAEEGDVSDFVPDVLIEPGTGPETQSIQRSVLKSLREAISQDLTERQRRALMAVVVHGIPLEEVARRMDTNRNALYKLLHDARQRLKKAILARGYSVEEILRLFGPPDDRRNP